MVSSEGKKLLVEAEAGKRNAEAYAAEAKDRMEEYRVECDERVAKEKKFTAAAVGEQRRAEAKAAKLKAEMDALSTGNTKDPALSARGRLLAKALTEGTRKESVRKQREVDAAQRSQRRAEAETIRGREKVKKTKQLRNQANARARGFKKDTKKLEKALAKHEKSRDWSKYPKTKLPAGMLEICLRPWRWRTSQPRTRIYARRWPGCAGSCRTRSAGWRLTRSWVYSKCWATRARSTPRT